MICNVNNALEFRNLVEKVQNFVLLIEVGNYGQLTWFDEIQKDKLHNDLDFTTEKFEIKTHPLHFLEVNIFF